MKTLLPVFETKLFLLGFVIACTIFLANNCIQRDNLFEISQSKEEKLMAETDMALLKTKRAIHSDVTDDGEPEFQNAKTAMPVNGADMFFSSNNAVKAGRLSASRNKETTVRNSAAEAAMPETTAFNIKAFPNSTGDQFTLYLENATNEKVSVVVYDEAGGQVKKFEKENGNIPIHFGLNFKVHMYVVEVRQGENRKTLKLIKQ